MNSEANGCWDLVVEVVGCSRDCERGGKTRESRVYRVWRVNQNLLTLDWLRNGSAPLLKNVTKKDNLLALQGRQVVRANYFINNDLGYVKGGSSSSKYATFTTRTKAKYDNIEGIEDMVPTLWSPVKVAYNKHAVRGTYH
nr:hypothetical protein [Tanacetum cinerariifolium]